MRAIPPRRCVPHAPVLVTFLITVLLLSSATPAWAQVNEIVIGNNPAPAARFAAEQFQQLYQRATGTRPSIRETSEASDGRLYIGAAAIPDMPSIALDDLGPEDLRIRMSASDIAIAGGSPRGTLYGVYEFLERRMGVRFLAPEHTHVPEIDESDLIEPWALTYRPPLPDYRHADYGITQQNPVYAARLRNNVITNPPRLGGASPMTLINHSFPRWVNTNEHGEAHPEYFALRDGRRLNEPGSEPYRTQPCMTHPQVRRLIIEGVLAELEANPNVGNISVSQNDNPLYCQCANCEAITQRESSAMGPLLDLVNEVADAVAEEHPDVMVGTLAYQYSRTPPEHMRPRENVQIQLASIEACVLHPIDSPDCPENAAFREDLAAWGEITDRVYIWNYNVNFWNYLLPHPNLQVIGPNVQYFAANGARGVFMQAARQANVASMDTLRNYVIHNMLWNPSRDAAELRDEFITLHYGQAAEPIRQWLNLVQETALESGLHRHCFADAVHYGLGEAQLVERGLELFDEALERAKSDAIRHRVRRAALSVHRLAMEPAMRAMRDRGPWNEELAERMLPKVERFYEKAAAFDMNVPVEWTNTEAEKARMRELFGLDEDYAF